MSLAPLSNAAALSPTPSTALTFLSDTAQKTADGASQIAQDFFSTLPLGSIEQELLGEVIKREHWLSTQTCKDMDIESDSPCQELRDFLPNFQVDPLALQKAATNVADFTEMIELRSLKLENVKTQLQKGTIPENLYLTEKQMNRLSDLSRKHPMPPSEIKQPSPNDPPEEEPPFVGTIQKNVYVDGHYWSTFEVKTRPLTEPERNSYKQYIKITSKLLDLERRELKLLERIYDSLRVEDAIWEAFSQKLTQEYYLQPGEKRLLAIQFEAWRQSIPYLMPDVLSQFNISDDDLAKKFDVYAHDLPMSIALRDQFVDELYHSWWLPLFDTWQKAQEKIQQENWPHQKFYQAWRLSVGGRCSGELRSFELGALGDVARWKLESDVYKRGEWSLCVPRMRYSKHNPKPQDCVKDMPEHSWAQYYHELPVFRGRASKEAIRELNHGVPSVETIYQWARADYEKAKALMREIHSYATEEELQKFYQETDQRDIFRFDHAWLFITNQDAESCMRFTKDSPSTEQLMTGNKPTLPFPFFSGKTDAKWLSGELERRAPKLLADKLLTDTGKGYEFRNGWRDRFELWKNPPSPPPPPKEPPPFNLTQVPLLFQRVCEKLCELGKDSIQIRWWIWSDVENLIKARLSTGDQSRLLDEETLQMIFDRVMHKREYKEANPNLPCDCALEGSTYSPPPPPLPPELEQKLPPYNLEKLPEIFQRSCQKLSSLGRDTGSDLTRKILWKRSQEAIEHFLYDKRVAGLDQVLTDEELEKVINRTVYLDQYCDYTAIKSYLPSDCTFRDLPYTPPNSENQDSQKTSATAAAIGLALTAGAAAAELARRRFTNASIKTLFTKAASTIAATVRATKRRFQNTPITAAAIVTVESGAAITTLLANEAITITAESGAELLNQQLDAEHHNLDHVRMLPAE